MVDRLWEKETMKVKDCWNLLLPMNWLLVTPGSRRNLNIWLHTSQEIVKPKLTTYCIREVFRKMVSNKKVIVGEECATQHRLVVGDFKVCTHTHPKRRFVSRIKVWKLKDFGNQVEFSNFFNTLIQGNETGKTLDECWKYLKNNLINATKQVCGVSAKHTWKRQTWWWNDKVQKVVSHKRKCFKIWKSGGDRDAYQAAKRASNLAVHSQN